MSVSISVNSWPQSLSECHGIMSGLAIFQGLIHCRVLLMSDGNKMSGVSSGGSCKSDVRCLAKRAKTWLILMAITIKLHHSIHFAHVAHHYAETYFAFSK